jgi:hypothetical protein
MTISSSEEPAEATSPSESTVPRQRSAPEGATPPPWQPRPVAPAGYPERPAQGSGRFWVGFVVGAVAMLVIGVLLVTVAAILGLPGGKTVSSPTVPTSILPSSYTLQGSITLAATSSFGSANYTSNAGTCQGTNGYNDMTAGAGVNVYSAQGTVVAIGQLQPGNVTAGGCTFSFSAPGVPDNGGIVQVEVSHRGRISLPPEEAKGGNASFTLGSN